MNFKNTLLIALFSFSIAQSAFAETDTEKFNRAVQLYYQANYTAAFPLIKQLAEQGDVSSQYNLALIYNRSYDSKQALYWYQKAAEQGHVEAQERLARMYELGMGTTKNEKQADYWYQKAAHSYQKAAEQGDASAQNSLAAMYKYGQGVARDMKQAAYWYTKAAEQGDITSQYNLAERYKNGEGVTQDDKQALYWYQKAAEQGHTESQFRLGDMYYYGKGVAQNHIQAAYWYQKAAEQGHDESQFRLGDMYYSGEGVAQNHIQAVYWYQEAAEQLHSNARHKLGYMYYKGEGVRLDKSKAKHYFEGACLLAGISESCKFYSELKNAESAKTNEEKLKRAKQFFAQKNYSAASSLYKELAEQGNPDAQYYLGFINDSVGNKKQAVYWYTKAADQESNTQAYAQRNLGFMYMNGEGVRLDYSKAKHYLGLACDNGDGFGCKYYADLEKQGVR